MRFNGYSRPLGDPLEKDILITKLFRSNKICPFCEGERRDILMTVPLSYIRAIMEPLKPCHHTKGK
jgi:hypothetical protein